MKYITHTRLILCVIAYHLLIEVSLKVSSIRTDVSLQLRNPCRITVQGRILSSDDNGYVCSALSVDPESHCCPVHGEKYSCHGCNLASQCCNSYEFCVSCCLNPVQTPKEKALKVKLAKFVTAGTYMSVFEFCTGRCRHSSGSVVHENTYISDFHHCYALPSNSSGNTDGYLESRLSGVSVVVGRQGQACSFVCKSIGKSCLENKLSIINNCEILEKYFSCKGSCIASSAGTDFPSQVVDDTPTADMNPGLCSYGDHTNLTTLSCEGFHPHTRRLCPCA